ncbi:Aste57867_1884 [Aphanomyces stellatus]|uniref:Aste57867_1884 protein n=1 Tax=Aphanomyces stellatus TaxID=120398 RepID=A0A485KBE8_9STRA|nr:hypothetical protein As57867_001882 [Aphanomyces stellatus]VFT79091.1 Aste57867_1884 [Aphanomyces stellatus]
MVTVRLPLLCISALDDPIVGRDALPDAICRTNTHIILCKTKYGGRLGFLQGKSGNQMWPSNVVAQYCSVGHDDQAATFKRSVYACTRNLSSMEPRDST